jgi:S-adenosylmethionine:tRNA ribosyltransferase-isomerase
MTAPGSKLDKMEADFSLDSYDYFLPEDRIARYPATERHGSRLLVLNRAEGKIEHRRFRDIVHFLRPGDCLVVNDSKVFPARLVGRKPTGGRLEIFLLRWPVPSKRQAETGEIETSVLYRASKPLRKGELFSFCSDRDRNLCIHVEVLEPEGPGRALIRLIWEGDLEEVLGAVGRVPLPPYIRRADEEMDRSRYQTVYARRTGSVAAPTAGLHFTPELLAELDRIGVGLARLTLHVGYGTFAPIRASDIRDHRIHSEWIEISPKAAEAVNSARARGGRIIAVGTTSVRSLEFAADEHGRLQPFAGECDLYILPGHRFRIVEGMITNFHLPRSSLLVLVSAFAGRELILSVYQEAVEAGYRFYSYGDAMLIL